jgi:hypothetical protein
MNLKLIAASLAAFISLNAVAQTPVNQAYAITSQHKGGLEWTEVKRIDLKTGSVISNVFENSKNQYNLFDGRTAKQLILKETDSTSYDKRPFSGLSAACAYDRKSNRLYFAPLFINQLRYIDLSTSVPSVYIFENEKFSNSVDMDAEANQITRMVIAGDGNGYALNNDGSHLVRFTTGESPVITDLGALTNGADNGDMSIDDANTSWGGDMVSDAAGNLYLISAHNNVFRINLQTKTASFIQEIKGLPAGFTTNGAVVDGEGNLVISSANSIVSYYNVNPNNWNATAITTNEEVFNSSDLANENLLFKTRLAELKTETVQESISVYPNPVKTNSFKVTFTNKQSGDYNVQLVDVAGRMISDKAVVVSNSGQVSEVKIDPTLSRGMYMVKVLNHNNKELLLKKIMVQ